MSSELRVLIVDDDISIRQSLTLFLRDCDFEVTSAETADEALDLLGRFPHDVALVDMRLGEVDGESLILKCHEVSPSTVFLIHTGSEDFTLSPSLEEIGMKEHHLFVKPVVDMNKFVETIQRLAHEK